jgi:hypothetical protein
MGVETRCERSAADRVGQAALWRTRRDRAVEMVIDECRRRAGSVGLLNQKVLDPELIARRLHVLAAHDAPRPNIGVGQRVRRDHKPAVLHRAGVGRGPDDRKCHVLRNSGTVGVAAGERQRVDNRLGLAELQLGKLAFGGAERPLQGKAVVADAQVHMKVAVDRIGQRRNRRGRQAGTVRATDRRQRDRNRGGNVAAERIRERKGAGGGKRRDTVLRHDRALGPTGRVDQIDVCKPIGLIAGQVAGLTAEDPVDPARGDRRAPGAVAVAEVEEGALGQERRRLVHRVVDERVELIVGVAGDQVVGRAGKDDVASVGTDLRPDAGAVRLRVAETDRNLLDRAGLQVLHENVGKLRVAGDEIRRRALEHDVASVSADRRCPAVVGIVIIGIIRRRREGAAVAIAIRRRPGVGIDGCRHSLQPAGDEIVGVDLGLPAGVDLEVLVADVDFRGRGPERDHMAQRVDRRR